MVAEDRDGLKKTWTDQKCSDQSRRVLETHCARFFPATVSLLDGAFTPPHLVQIFTFAYDSRSLVASLEASKGVLNP